MKTLSLRPLQELTRSQAERVQAALTSDAADWLNAGSTPRKQRERLDDAFYARLASRYYWNRENEERNPVQQLAGELKQNESTVRAMLRRARLRGILTTATKAGKDGGRLTKKAIELINASR